MRPAQAGIALHGRKAARTPAVELARCTPRYIVRKLKENKDDLILPGEADIKALTLRYDKYGGMSTGFR